MKKHLNSFAQESISRKATEKASPPRFQNYQEAYEVYCETDYEEVAYYETI